MRPFVSIVIPLYNKADSVRQSLLCAASQVDADFEIIVVDDGSTDGGADLVKTAGVPRLRLIQQVNAGASAARNRGIAEAEGRWIAFLDADDLWSQDHLACLTQVIKRGDVVAAFSNVQLQSRAGRPLLDTAVPAQKVSDYFSFALSNGGYPTSSSSIIAQKQELIAAGLFAEAVSSGEDIDMWCRLACRGPFFYNARLSSTYNDARSPTRFPADEVVFPAFAQHFPQLIRDGKLPSVLTESARRYVNFLILEYARQLLDCGRYAEARSVLLKHCVPTYDLNRYLKRLVRTSFLGRSVYRFNRAERTRGSIQSEPTKMSADVSAPRSAPTEERSTIRPAPMPDYVEHQENVPRLAALVAEAVVCDHESGATKIEEMGAELINAAQKCEARIAELQKAVSHMRDTAGHYREDLKKVFKRIEECVVISRDVRNTCDTIKRRIEERRIEHNLPSLPKRFPDTIRAAKTSPRGS